VNLLVSNKSDSYDGFPSSKLLRAYLRNLFRFILQFIFSITISDSISLFYRRFLLFSTRLEPCYSSFPLFTGKACNKNLYKVLERISLLVKKIQKPQTDLKHIILFQFVSTSIFSRKQIYQPFTLLKGFPLYANDL